MVFVWSNLCEGEPHFTLSQVALNDSIMVFAFAPLVALLLGVASITVPWDTLLLSVVLYIVLPVIVAQLLRAHADRAAASAALHTDAARSATALAAGALLAPWSCCSDSRARRSSRGRWSSRCSPCRSCSRSISMPASPTG